MDYDSWKLMSPEDEYDRRDLDWRPMARCIKCSDVLTGDEDGEECDECRVDCKSIDHILCDKGEDCDAPTIDADEYICSLDHVTVAHAQPDAPRFIRCPVVVGEPGDARAGLYQDKCMRRARLVRRDV